MTLWFSVRRLPAVFAVLVSMLALISLAGDIGMSVPNLYGGPNLAVPISLLAPLSLVIALGYGLTSGETQIEAVACRPVAIFDALLVAICGAISASVLLIVDNFSVVGLGDAAARNTLGYLGLLLIGRSILGTRSASLLPVGIAFVSMLFGATATRDVRIWAWPIASGDNTVSWVLALTCILVGALLSLIRSPYSV